MTSLSTWPPAEDRNEQDHCIRVSSLEHFDPLCDCSKTIERSSIHWLLQQYIAHQNIFKKHELRIVNSAKYKRLTASSRGLKCKKFCKICCCKNFAKFLHNFWLILFSRRVCKMRDWQSLLLFFFCRKFKKYFAKLLQTFCNKFSSV